LHALAVGTTDSKTLPALDVLLSDLHAALGPAEPAHAMGKPRRSEPRLHHAQPVADAAEHVIVMNFEAVELELAMAAMFLRAKDFNAAHDPPAGLILVVEERGDALPPVVGGARREDEMGGAVGAGDEPLATIDLPLVAVLLRIGLDHAGVGAAARRGLGHRHRRA